MLKPVLLTIVCLGLVAVPARASIDPDAPGNSHALELAADAIHTYLHDFYSSSFGAHGLEDDAVVLHDNLHGWQNGTVTESQIAADWDAVDAAWKNFKQTINQAKVLNEGDDTLDDLFDDAKDAYKAVRYSLRNVQS